MRRGPSDADELWRSILRHAPEEIAPEVDPDSEAGFRYPFLEGVGLDPASTDPLESLVRKGELVRVTQHVLFLCPEGHRDLRLARRCPNCGSEDVVRHRLLEHATCGHVAEEDAFRTEGGHRCPNCSELVAETAAGELDDFVRCHACGVDMEEAESAFHCPGCDRYYTEAETTEVPLHAYRRPGGESSVLESILAEAGGILRRAGYEVSRFASREGASGTRHPVDLYAVRTLGGRKEETILDVALAEEAVGAEPLVTLFAKAEDLGVGRVRCVAVPRLDPNAREYGRLHDLRLLEGDSAFVRDAMARFLAEERWAAKEQEEARLREEEERLADLGEDLEAREQVLRAWESVLEGRERDLARAQVEAQEREKGLEIQAAELQARRHEVRGRAQTLEGWERDLVALENRLVAREKEVLRLQAALEETLHEFGTRAERLRSLEDDLAQERRQMAVTKTLHHQEKKRLLEWEKEILAARKKPEERVSPKLERAAQ